MTIMNLKYILTIFIILLLASSIHIGANAQSTDTTSQEVLSDTISIKIAPKKEKDYSQKDTTKLINKYIKKGDKIFDAEYKRYDLALVQYVKAEQYGANSQHFLFNVGYANFQLKNYSKAKYYFDGIAKNDSVEDVRTLYYLGRVNHLLYNFDTAIYYFDEYYKKLSSDELENQRKDITRHQQFCENAKIIYASPNNAILEKLGSNVNTNFVEYASIASIHDDLLVFTSRRPGKKDNDRDHLGRYFDKVYYSTKDESGKWLMAKPFGKKINNSDHNAAAGLSADGKKLIIYRSDNNGDLFISDFKNGKWKSPKNMGSKINSDGHDASASFSYDRLRMFLSSDRSGGFGGHDLYVSSLNEKEKWNKVVNMGAKINTAFDEIALVALPDDKTYYFSSNGHNSMGGYDIFKITYEDSMWSEPVNLGYPINTPDDDVLYSVSMDGKFAYIASSRNDSSMHDIYKVTFPTKVKYTVDELDGLLLVIMKRGAILPEMDAAINIKKMNLTVLKGTIYDEYSKEPLYASIELTDNSTNKVVATFTSNEQTGKYLVSLPSGKDYGIAVKAENCLFHSENISIKNEKGYKEIVKDISLKRIAVGSKVVLKNVFFASGKAKLSPSSKTELDNLLKLLNDIPNLKLEIAGHTDSVGKASSNKKLSAKRAQAVVDFLVKNGISSDRLVSKGYGEDKPVATNKTKEGRQQNRRTEFEVIAR